MTDPPPRPAPALSRGKRLRYRLEYALLRAAVWFIPKLPLGLVRGIANACGTLGWMVDGRGRTNGMENLRCALGSPQR